MTRDVVLDSPTVSLLTQRPGRSPEGDACKLWLANLLKNGDRAYLPEIVDYEVRRELLRANRVVNLSRLDMLKENARYLPLTTEAMLQAAKLWAQARQQRQQTAPNPALDIDVILAAQALSLGSPSRSIVVATANVDHLARYIATARWQDI